MHCLLQNPASIGGYNSARIKRALQSQKVHGWSRLWHAAPAGQPAAWHVQRRPPALHRAVRLMYHVGARARAAAANACARVAACRNIIREALRLHPTDACLRYCTGPPARWLPRCRPAAPCCWPPPPAPPAPSACPPGCRTWRGPSRCGAGRPSSGRSAGGVGGWGWGFCHCADILLVRHPWVTAPSGSAQRRPRAVVAAHQREGHQRLGGEHQQGVGILEGGDGGAQVARQRQVSSRAGTCTGVPKQAL